jgi:hypothetical protein
VDSSRSHSIVIGTIVATAVVSVVSGAATLSGFGSAPAGDVIVSSTPAAGTLLLLVGLVLMIGLEWSHVSARRSGRTAGASVPATARS